MARQDDRWHRQLEREAAHRETMRRYLDAARILRRHVQQDAISGQALRGQWENLLYTVTGLIEAAGRTQPSRGELADQLDSLIAEIERLDNPPRPAQSWSD